MKPDEWIALWQAEAERDFSGWDFSYIADRYQEEKPPWSYDALVRALLPAADSVLDMGTGGGEKLREFADALPRQTFATEGYAPNIPVATANLQPLGIQVVPYDSEEDTRMPFADDHFALIINRHEAFDAAEIARVLRPGGVFLTQQVGGDDMADLLTRFGMQPDYPHVTLPNFRQELEAAGLVIEGAADWQGRSMFSDVGALVYFLHAVPWHAPDDFSVANYADTLLALQALPKPLTFTVRRFWLQACKPSTVGR